MIRPTPAVERLVRVQTPKIGRRTKLRLDINENVVGWPADVVHAVLATVGPDDLAAYPETHALYAAIARRHGLTPDRVLVASGSELVIRYVFETFLGPGRELLILDPSFAMFEVYGRLFGAAVRTIPFGRGMRVEAADVVRQITDGTTVLAIANPNNPTGTVFTSAEIALMAERAAKVGCLVLVDEAYYYFHRETVAPLLDPYDNVVVTRTFSKAFGLAGVRLGYALGSAAVIAAAQKVQPIDHANVFAVRFGEYAIEHEEVAWRYADEVSAGKAHLLGRLRALGLTCVDSHANFVLVDFGVARERIVSAIGDRALVGATVRLPFPNDYVKITVGPVAQMTALLEMIAPLVKTSTQA